MSVEVSIITPAYNCKKTILETYESIKNQSFSNWEWIVVEDCSTDGSFDYIKEITNGDKRVTLLRNEKNCGTAISRNKAIDVAKGRFIAFLDADDMWKKDKLEHQIAFMKDNNYSFTYTNYEVVFPNGTIKKYKPKKDVANYKSLLGSNYVGTLTVIYDSSILGKKYMPTDCNKREDHCAWLDLTRDGTLGYCLNEDLARYRVDSRSLSGAKLKLIKHQYRVYRRHEGFGIIRSLWYLFLCINTKVFKKY